MAPVLGLSVIHNGPFDQRLRYNETGRSSLRRGGPPSAATSAFAFLSRINQVQFDTAYSLEQVRFPGRLARISNKHDTRP